MSGGAAYKSTLEGLRGSLDGFKKDIKSSLSMWAEDFDLLGSVLLRMIDKQRESLERAKKQAIRDAHTKKQLQSHVNRLSCVREKEHEELATLRETVAQQNKQLQELRNKVERKALATVQIANETPTKKEQIVVVEDKQDTTPPQSTRQSRRQSVSSTLTKTTEAYAAKRKNIQPHSTHSILKRPKHESIEVTDENSSKQVTFQTEHTDSPFEEKHPAARYPLRERVPGPPSKPAMRVRRSSLGSSIQAAARVLASGSTTSLPLFIHQIVINAAAFVRQWTILTVSLSGMERTTRSADDILSILTDGMVQNATLVGETWEALCARKIKALPSAKATAPVKKELTTDEMQLARSIYDQGVIENPDLDLDDVVLQVLEHRHDRVVKSDVDRAYALRQFQALPASTLLKIKKANGGYMTFSPLQFATFFGDRHVVQSMLKFAEVEHAAEALLEAAKEGYATIAQCLLDHALPWNPHDIGRSFVLASLHSHLDVLEVIIKSQHADLALLCKGAWCTRDQLGLRYISAAAHVAIAQNHVEALGWLLKQRQLYADELKACFQLAVATHSSLEDTIACLPLLRLLVQDQPWLTAVATELGKHNVRLRAVASYVIWDLHTNDKDAKGG
ncbi:hypothetical protein LEN26_007147 [Aphanomyces euteiches]|nr:hypothetical protein AeMF1_018182 [Aphanomyces euteiches]KAH9133184.1 hypothetical protein LEN26_007147 [Aphanomyces euteiches]